MEGRRKLRDKDGDPGFSARTGDIVVHLAGKVEWDHFAVGGYVNIRGADSVGFYRAQEAQSGKPGTRIRANRFSPSPPSTSPPAPSPSTSPWSSTYR
ncbi:hypothetical protein [Actinokineospora iranica]|uniref:hypothetical protein n=1 Tax=Actinokineospora iranica TaxID=1271860 RepID=UPI0011134FCE|nr:hypothetical protein [Actinokineospora iranica]